MDIDESAPVAVAATIEIDAPRERVWELMSDFARWPAWNPDVSWAQIDGELAAGTSFRWKAGPGTIRSILREVQSPESIGWTGSTLGIRAVHVWRLDETGSITRVTTEESWSGILPRLLRRTMSKILARSIDRGLAALKEAAERQGGSQAL